MKLCACARKIKKRQTSSDGACKTTLEKGDADAALIAGESGRRTVTAGVAAVLTGSSQKTGGDPPVGIEDGGVGVQDGQTVGLAVDARAPHLVQGTADAAPVAWRAEDDPLGDRAQDKEQSLEKNELMETKEYP